MFIDGKLRWRQRRHYYGFRDKSRLHFSSKSNITSGSNLNLNSTNGLLGIGTQNPNAALTVEGNYGSNAAEIVNQQGGDIFTASSSGTTQFTIANNGTLTASEYTVNGGLLYTNNSGVIEQITV